MLPAGRHSRTAEGAQCRGAFFSLLTGDEFLAAALCLRHQLLLVQSACPFHLVYDASTLSNASITRLRQTFSQAALLPLSRLVARSRTAKERARQTALSTRGSAHKGRLTSADEGGSRDSRKPSAIDYPSDGSWRQRMVATSLQKLWLWALPAEQFPLACYIDLDVHVRSNLDALLSPDMHQVLAKHRLEFAAVNALGCPAGHLVFSAGLFVFVPSLVRLESLLRRERSCEHAHIRTRLLSLPCGSLRHVSVLPVPVLCAQTNE